MRISGWQFLILQDLMILSLKRVELGTPLKNWTTVGLERKLVYSDERNYWDRVKFTFKNQEASFMSIFENDEFQEKYNEEVLYWTERAILIQNTTRISLLYV